jgi:hypothetical protein
MRTLCQPLFLIRGERAAQFVSIDDPLSSVLLLEHLYGVESQQVQQILIEIPLECCDIDFALFLVCGVCPCPLWYDQQQEDKQHSDEPLQALDRHGDLL